MLLISVSSTFTLTPAKLAYVCPGQQATLKCETSANFLRWNITFADTGYTDERLVTSYGIPDIVPLKIVILSSTLLAYLWHYLW